MRRPLVPCRSGRSREKHLAGHRRRVGVVVAELGIPSEVWIIRQCLEFERIEPVLLYWKMHDRAVEVPDALERRQFQEPFRPKPSLVRRAARRLGFPSAVLPDRTQLADIRRTVEAARVEALLCHFAWTGLPVSAAIGSSLPVVWHVHGRDVSSQMRDAAYRRAVARALPKLDHLVAVGSFQLDLLSPYGLGPGRSVIPCGAPLSLFGQTEMPRRGDGEPVRFITVGRLSAEKGVLETLRAFEAVAARHPNAELAYVGGGPLEPELSRAIAASAVASKVRLLGLLPPAEVARELSRSHVYVQHSRRANGSIEGFGVTLTEAGASGLPLVASRLGGIPDQVRHGENGFLFEPEDVAEQAACMLRLAEDEDLRRRMGGAAREVARTFDSKLMSRRLEDVLLGSMPPDPVGPGASLQAD